MLIIEVLSFPDSSFDISELVGVDCGFVSTLMGDIAVELRQRDIWSDTVFGIDNNLQSAVLLSTFGTPAVVVACLFDEFAVASRVQRLAQFGQIRT